MGIPAFNICVKGRHRLAELLSRLISVIAFSTRNLFIFGCIGWFVSYVVKIAEDMFFSSIHLIRSQISVILSSKGYKVGILLVHSCIFLKLLLFSLMLSVT